MIRFTSGHPIRSAGRRRKAAFYAFFVRIKQKLANLFLVLLSTCPCPGAERASRKTLSNGALRTCLAFRSQSPVTGLLGQDRKQVPEFQRILPSRGRKPEDHFRAFVEFDGKFGPQSAQVFERVGFVKEDAIECFARRPSPGQVSLANLFRAFARFSLKDFAQAIIVQDDHFLDPSIGSHPLDTGTPVGDNSKGANDKYHPFLLRAFENLENTGPRCEGLSKPNIIGQKKAWIPLFIGEEYLRDSLEFKLALQGA